MGWGRRCPFLYIRGGWTNVVWVFCKAVWGGLMAVKGGLALVWGGLGCFNGPLAGVASPSSSLLGSTANPGKYT